MMVQAFISYLTWLNWACSEKQISCTVCEFACLLCGLCLLCMFGHFVYAGFVHWLKSCCCPLPAVISRLLDCNAACLQHLPLHTITTVSAISIGLVCSFCCQIWLHDTSSYSGVSCVKIGLLYSGPRSQWRFKSSLDLFVSFVFSVTLISW